MRVTIRFADSVDKKGVKIPSHLDELSKRQRTDKSLIWLIGRDFWNCDSSCLFFVNENILQIHKYTKVPC